MQHPIREAEIRIFKSVDEPVEFTARLKPYRTWPIIFTAATEEGVRQQAQAFIAETIVRHEAAFVARQEGLAKAREARARAAVRKAEDA